MPADLFTPLRIGRFDLAHRVVMAPLTRMRARPQTTPWALNAEYYGQRATPGGLIIGEATQVAPEGQGYPDTPGLHSAEQEAGWRLTTDAIHAEQGIAFAQLWHVGRISHSSHQPDGQLPIAPSALAAEGRALDAAFAPVPFETPRAVDPGEIPGLVDAFRRGAERALAAGFDGAEVHAANGYLIQQFLESHSNHRTDPYGGSIEHRARFALEVVDAVVEVLGGDRVGVRLSPFGSANDSHGGEDVEPLYRHLLGELATRDLAYLHLIEPRGHRDKPAPSGVESGAALLRDAWTGPLIAAGGFTPDSGAALVAAGTADAIAFGRTFIANPDLPERIRAGKGLNPYDRTTFYGGDHRGYTDYPALAG